jgi:hypothetical protein
MLHLPKKQTYVNFNKHITLQLIIGYINVLHMEDTTPYIFVTV